MIYNFKDCVNMFSICWLLPWTEIYVNLTHYGVVIMGTIASQITSLTIVYSTVYSDADQRKHQSSASLAFVRGIHRGPVNSPHKWPVTRKMFPFDDVIMWCLSSIVPYGMLDKIPAVWWCNTTEGRGSQGWSNIHFLDWFLMILHKNGLNGFITRHLIMITCISYEITFTKIYQYCSTFNLCNPCYRFHPTL